jgi:4-hydroxy-3-methylbut-2-enyl diphosphate reductase
MSRPVESLLVLAPLWLEARAIRPALPGATVLRCGLGPARARRAAERLAGRTPAPRAIAVAGVCGALDPRLVPGDLVVASELRGAGAPRALESAKPLARALEARGARVHIGPMLSLDHLVRRAERESLAATGAIAVDMESAWLAALADELPFAVLRVVSDGPDHELFGARVLANGVRALRALRAAAPALATWADSPEGEP